MKDRYVVARVADIPPGDRKVFAVKGREIGVFNIKGEFFALLNKCPHQGAAVCRGDLVGVTASSGPGDYRHTRNGELLKCPWHGWMFDVRTGQSWCDPGEYALRSFAVEVQPGESLAQGPFAAETFEVSVEDELVLVHV